MDKLKTNMHRLVPLKVQIEEALEKLEESKKLLPYSPRYWEEADATMNVGLNYIMKYNSRLKVISCWIKVEQYGFDHHLPIHWDQMQPHLLHNKNLLLTSDNEKVREIGKVVINWIRDKNSEGQREERTQGLRLV